MGAATIGFGTSNVKSWANSITGLPEQEVTLPVLFTSHGNP
ncbi:MAG TPA: dioxygenase, partial [Algoriphagus sp.]|nr:dioxygenase [Algoriphagus sp.]